MSSSKSLSGLMKWLNNDDWEDAFFSVLDQHFEACEAHGLEASELEELLGDAGFAICGDPPSRTSSRGGTPRGGTSLTTI
jgi:hypothetical protein